jgi:large subunit ribosomal protein L30
MQLDNFLEKKIVVTQLKSGSKLNNRQKANLVGLGLRGIGSFSILNCSGAILGMIRKVAHIIKISLI